MASIKIILYIKPHLLALCIIYLKHKAAEKRTGLLWSQVIKDTIEQQLCDEELISTGDLTGHSALNVYDIRGVTVAQASQNSLTTLQLIHL